MGSGFKNGSFVWSPARQLSLEEKKENRAKDKRQKAKRPGLKATRLAKQARSQQKSSSPTS